MILRSVSIFGQTTEYRIYTVSREPIRLLEIQYPVFGIYRNPGSLVKKLHEHFRGNKSDPPSTFDTILPIDMVFGTYNELPLYFQLSLITWCFIGFHGNHLGCLSFQISFNFQL